MDLNVNRQTLEAERLVGAQTRQLLLRAEALVSGAGREEIEILMSDASASLGSVDVQTDRVVLDGTVSAQAAYRLGSESTARALNARATFNHVFDIKGASPRMYAQVKTAVDGVTSKYENGHMVFDVSVTLSARVLELTPVELITGVEDAGGQAEAQYAQVRSVKLSAENTVTELVTERIALPAALDARTALMEWMTVSDVDARRDLGGVRVTGNVLCESLISSGVAARPVALVRYTMPFDRLVEMPEWLSGEVRAEASVKNATTEVEQAAGGDDGALRMEAEVEIHISALGEDSVNALKDAYSTGAESLNVVTRRLEVCTGAADLCVSEPFRGTLLLPDGAGAVGSVLAVRARASVGDVSYENGRTTLSGVVDAQVLYMSGSGDRLMRAASEMPFEVTIAAELKEDAWITVTATGAEGNALMSDRVEIKCMLNICSDKRESENIEIVEDISASGENDRAHGVLMVWPSQGDSAWSIGKKYKTPVARVREANGGSDDVKSGKALVMMA